MNIITFLQTYQSRVVDSLEEEYVEDDEYGNQNPEVSGHPIGRWRSTGKALEPKWRDGDYVPLVPFHTETVPNKSSIEKNQPSIEDSEENDDKNYASKRQHALRKLRNQEKSTIISDEYDFNRSHKPNDKNDYRRFRNPEIRLKRRRRPPQLENEEKYQPVPNEYEDLLEINNQDGSKKGRHVPSLSNDNSRYLEGVALRYRETFQNHPNEYELNDEEYQRPRPRKRRPPQNDEFVEVKTSTFSNDKVTSSPLSSTTNSERKQKTTQPNDIIRRNNNRTLIGNSNYDQPPKNTELESLLKMQQVEGLSLSDSLQGNLTLSDLLQGKTDVINLLKSRHEDNESKELNSMAKSIETIKNSGSSNDIPSTTERVPWRPRQTVPTKSFQKPVSDQFSIFRAASTDVYQIMPTQEEKENVHPTESMKSTKIPVSSEVPIVVTTTESVILQEKDKVKITYDEDEIMEFSDFTVNNSKPSSKTDCYERTINYETTSKIDSFNRDSKSTLSNKDTLDPTEQSSISENGSKEDGDKFSKQSERIQYENKIAYSGNENDNIRNTKIDSFELEYQDDEGHDSIHEIGYKENIKILKEEATFKEDSRTTEEPPLPSHKTFLNHKNYEIYPEMEPDARAEILELFNTNSSANKLESLLKARNMSIEDLIALRRRGSSQLHLAEVAQSRDNLFRLSTDKDVGESQDFQNNSHENENVKTVKPDCSSFREAKVFVKRIEDEELNKKPMEEVLHIKEFETLPPNWSDQFGDPDSFTSNKERKQESKEQINLERFEETRTEQFPESFKESDGFLNTLSNLESSRSSKTEQSTEGISYYTNNSEEPDRRNNSMILTEDDRVHESVSDVSNTFSNIYRLNSDNKESREKHSISKIKPSIIASGAILGVTIVVFLGIFIACRIRQKQKYTYRNTFSRTVFQSPVVASRKLSNSSSLNTIMVNVVATSTTKRPEKTQSPETDDEYDVKSDIENDSLDANDSWETIPEYMK